MNDTMRDDEIFVGNCLIELLGGPDVVTASPGENPPDLYLTISNARIGVEVTQLWDFTFEPDGTLGNRVTQSSFGVQLLDGLNANFGHLLPDDVSLLVGIQVPVPNPARYRKILHEWLSKFAANPVIGAEEERIIDGLKARVSAIPKRKSGKNIVGYVDCKNSSSDIALNARLALQNAIRKKDKICAPLKKPLWLALLNAYWLADIETYTSALQQIEINHCFERILLVSTSGKVDELMLK